MTWHHSHATAKASFKNQKVERAQPCNGKSFVQKPESWKSKGKSQMLGGFRGNRGFDSCYHELFQAKSITTSKVRHKHIVSFHLFPNAKLSMHNHICRKTCWHTSSAVDAWNEITSARPILWSLSKSGKPISGCIVRIKTCARQLAFSTPHFGARRLVISKIKSVNSQPIDDSALPSGGR